MHDVSESSDATKNVTQSADNEIKQKQSEFERNAKKILGFKRFMSKISDMEKYCLLSVFKRDQFYLHTCAKQTSCPVVTRDFEYFIPKHIAVQTRRSGHV